jgi:4-hydroxyphenylacetate 3-monooxygenase
MPPAKSPLRLEVSGSAETLDITPARLIVAGYTGRDADAVAAHIAELAEIGVPEPPTVPAFYDLDPALLTTDAVVSVASPDSSGEVEPVIIRHGGRHYLAVGSDHTDRELEKTDIAGSKAACPKPIGETVLALPDDLSEFDFDAILATNEVDGEAYQRGALVALRTPADLLARLAGALPDTDGDVVVFGGTLPLLTGRFVFGRNWNLRLELGDGTVLAHTYETKHRSG